MLTTIHNDTVTITVSSLGAELQSIEGANGISYLWDGQPEHWKGRAPILFPIVGALRGGRADSEHGEVVLPQHGLARRAEWTLVNQSENSLIYRLCSDTESKAKYPYEFLLEAGYTLTNNGVTTSLTVANTGTVPMPYCIGGHPGFHVPLAEGEAFEDYLVAFEQPEVADIPGVDMEKGLILDLHRRRFLSNETTFRLNHDLFSNDALIFDFLQSHTVKVYSEKSGHGFGMDFKGFDIFAIWSPVTAAPFICLEPWTGCATRESEDDIFEHKQGMRLLQPGEERTVSFTVTVF